MSYLTDECGVWGLYPLYLVQQIPIKHKGNREFIFINSGSRVFSWEKLMKSNLVCVWGWGLVDILPEVLPVLNADYLLVKYANFHPGY